MNDTIICLFCQGTVRYSQNKTKKFENHLKNEHNITFQLNLLILLNIVNNGTLTQITDIGTKSLNNYETHTEDLIFTDNLNVQEMHSGNITLLNDKPKIDKIFEEESIHSEEQIPVNQVNENSLAEENNEQTEGVIWEVDEAEDESFFEDENETLFDDEDETFEKMGSTLTENTTKERASKSVAKVINSKDKYNNKWLEEEIMKYLHDKDNSSSVEECTNTERINSNDNKRMFYHPKPDTKVVNDTTCTEKLSNKFKVKFKDEKNKVNVGFNLKKIKTIFLESSQSCKTCEMAKLTKFPIVHDCEKKRKRDEEPVTLIMESSANFIEEFNHSRKLMLKTIMKKKEVKKTNAKIHNEEKRNLPNLIQPEDEMLLESTEHLVEESNDELVEENEDNLDETLTLESDDEAFEQDESFEEVDFLPIHIKKFNLPLKVINPTPAFGDCWWEACFDQLEINNMVRPRSALHLRQKVVRSLSKNPCFPTWLELGFDNDLKEFNAFKKEQLKSGTFTDEDGILVLATAMYLDVKVNIVAPDNNETNPFTTYNGGEGERIDFWVAHYPEDSTTGQEGHFQSLQYISF